VIHGASPGLLNLGGGVAVAQRGLGQRVQAIYQYTD
jgi:hypothetical protein